MVRLKTIAFLVRKWPYLTKLEDYYNTLIHYSQEVDSKIIDRSRVDLAN